jgi:hypothetical protein
MLKVRRRQDGSLILSIPFAEAFVLRDLPARLRQLLQGGFSERLARRLFPAAYRHERDQAEYQRLLGDDLRRRKLAGVEAFEKTVGEWTMRRRTVEIRVGPQELDLWLGFVNDMRIVLGVELDIQDDDWGREFDPLAPQAEDFALLLLLTWLEGELMRALGYE